MVIKREEKTKIILTDWLLKNNVDVFWEKKNKLNMPVFGIKGIIKKPDLILKWKWHWEKIPRYAAVEVKSGRHSKLMRDSHKIIDYYKKARDKDTQYFIGEKMIEPTIFLVATEYSLEGHLTKNEPMKEKVDLETAIIQGRPCGEYYQSYDFVRMLWQLWQEERCKSYALGIISAKKELPAVFVQIYNKRKNRWFGHRFYTIGG